jgi:LTXXQ motif family protein
LKADGLGDLETLAMALSRNIFVSFAALNLALAAAAAMAQPGQLRARPTAPVSRANPNGPMSGQIRSTLPNIPQRGAPRIAAPSQVIPVPRSAPQQFSFPASSDRAPSLKHAVPPNLIRRNLKPQADPSGSASPHATFQGHFADRFHRRRPIVIGWFGPLFWPYAYDDLVDYTLHSYAQDTFWPYAYDNLYDEMFGQYGYGSRATDANEETKEGVNTGGTTSSDICGGNIEALADRPIRYIAQVVGPDDSQRALLHRLQTARAEALEVLKTGCSKELPNSPTERIEAMRTRLMIMLQAVRIVRPALEVLYRSLNDEQKARFDAADHSNDQDRPQTHEDSMRTCSESAPGSQAPPWSRLSVRSNRMTHSVLY